MASVVLALCVSAAACQATSRSPDTPVPAQTRLVGARGLALKVPAAWRTVVEHGSNCPPTEPRTVMFFARVHGPVASCAVPDGASWPAEETLSISTRPLNQVRTFLDRQPSGRVDGMPYYLSDVKQLGPGVARRLEVPQLGVDFVAGASDVRTADAILTTIRPAPPGTPLR